MKNQYDYFEFVAEYEKRVHKDIEIKQQK